MADSVRKYNDGLPWFSDRLNRLIRTYCWRDGDRLRVYNNSTLADAVTAAGCRCTESHVRAMRQGKRPNPSATIVAALADLFEVSPLYFFDEEVALQINAELDARRAQLAEQVGRRR